MVSGQAPSKSNKSFCQKSICTTARKERKRRPPTTIIIHFCSGGSAHGLCRADPSTPGAIQTGMRPVTGDCGGEGCFFDGALGRLGAKSDDQGGSCCLPAVSLAKARETEREGEVFGMTNSFWELQSSDGLEDGPPSFFPDNRAVLIMCQ